MATRGPRALQGRCNLELPCVAALQDDSLAASLSLLRSLEASAAAQQRAVMLPVPEPRSIPLFDVALQVRPHASICCTLVLVHPARLATVLHWTLPERTHLLLAGHGAD